MDVKQEQLTQEELDEFSKGKKANETVIYPAKFTFTIKHLDIEEMVKDESQDVVENYLKALGLFVCLTNTTSKDEMAAHSLPSQIFRVNPELIKEKKKDITYSTTIQLKKEGKHSFDVLFCDSYGFQAKKTLSIDVT